MGILNTLLADRTAKDSGFTPREAFAGVLVSVMAADGHVSRKEIDFFFTILCRMRLFRGQLVDEYNAMVQKLLTQLKSNGRSYILERAAEGMPDELKETAFTIAADAAFADGEIEQEEMKALEEIQKAMSVSDTQAMKIIEVLKIRNRG